MAATKTKSKRQQLVDALEDCEPIVTNVTVPMYTCKKCSHKWIPSRSLKITGNKVKLERMPSECPGCGNIRWKQGPKKFTYTKV